MVYMVCISLLLYQYEYYLSMFSMETSLYLVDVFPLIFGFVGPVVAYFMGILFDKIGLGLSIFCGNCFCMIFFILNAIPSKGSIIASMIAFVAALSYVRMIGINFSQHYAPPELLGTLSGCIFTLMGVGQVVFATTLEGITSVIFSGDYWEYCVHFLTWVVGVLLTGSCMVYWFNFKHPFKKHGTASYTELREFQSKSATEELMRILH